SIGYREQATPTVIDAGLTLSDADSSTLSGATVTISGGFVAGDTLAFTNQSGITGSYDSATHVLSLTGIASVADYQAALRSVAFFSPSDDPTAGSHFSRTIS